MDKPADRLKQARLAAGFKSAADAYRRFASRFGIADSTYGSHENGGRDFNTEQAQIYADAYDVEPGWLLCLPESGSKMRDQDADDVVATAEAAFGLWRDPTVEQQQHSLGKKGSATVPTTVVRRRGAKRFAVKIVDASVDKTFPLGWYVICSPLADAMQAPEHFAVDDFLYIERTRHGLRELTVRRVSAVGGHKMRLSTHSSETRFKHDITYPPANGSVETIILLGKVVGRYGDFPG